MHIIYDDDDGVGGFLVIDRASGMVGIRSISTLSLRHLSAPRIFSNLLKTGITFKVNFFSYTYKKIILVLITGA